MKTFSLLFSLLFFSVSQAATFDGQVGDWKGKADEKFSDPEESFKIVMKRLRENYVDRGLSDEDLYRAATAGMLASLNSGKETENWNILMSPRMLDEFMIDKTGKLIGIGAVLEFDAKSGFARVVTVLPNSAALKAGLKKDDQILSVDGNRYKGKGLQEMVLAIRGPVGESVHLKVLREDRVLSLNISRDAVLIPAVEGSLVDSKTGLLTIGYFKNGIPALVEEKIQEFSGKKLQKLIIDLRGNSGGTFDDAIKVGEIFLPKDSVVVRTKARDGKIEEYKSHRDEWRPEVQIIVLTNGATASGAEILTSALKEGRHAMTIGQTTSGKWNIQSVENLPNKFAIKYTVSSFESGRGQNYQDVGMKPDLEIENPKEALLSELQNEADIDKRLKQDFPLKAAIEVRN